MKVDDEALSILHSQISETAKLVSIFAISQLEKISNDHDYIAANTAVIRSTDVCKNGKSFMESVRILIHNRFMLRVGPAKYLVNDFYVMNHNYPGSIINDVFFVDSDDYEIRE